MDWLSKLWKSDANKAEDERLAEEQKLIEEIRVAHAEWRNATRKFDYALTHDQIDYAIYVLEAAEKKYEILLKQAKEMGIGHSLQVAAAWHGGNKDKVADKQDLKKPGVGTEESA